jgi:capsular exopolysaccharide synthesis family protein
VERTGYFRLIWASKRWIALFAVAAAIVVYLASSSASNEYESKALGQIVSSSQASGEILSEEQLLSLSNLYHELATTETVLEIAHEDPAIKDEAADFNSSVEISPEARVGVLGFIAKTGDPELAAIYANTYANAFVTYLDQLDIDQRKGTLAPIQERIEEINGELAQAAPGDPNAAGLQVELQALQDRVATETANPGDTMRIVEHASPKSTPVSPRPKRDAFLALIGALILGVAAVYLRDIFFDRYRTQEEVARDLGLPLLGEIPKVGDSPALESFRSLRTAMTLVLERSNRATVNGGGEGGHNILVTGAESGCGKSYVAANISLTLAAEGRRVTTVDADLRRPSLQEIFKTSLSPGLSDLLVGSRAPDVTDVAVPVDASSGVGAALGELRLVPAGAHGEDAVESLSSERMTAVVDQLRKESDTVVFDSPPTLVVVDPIVLARYADGVLFVVDSRRTRRRDARRAVEALRAIGAPLLGFAFNRSETKQSRYDAYRPRDPQRRAPASKGSRV